MRESDRDRRSVSTPTAKSSVHMLLLDDAHFMTYCIVTWNKLKDSFVLSSLAPMQSNLLHGCKLSSESWYVLRMRQRVAQLLK